MSGIEGLKSRLAVGARDRAPPGRLGPLARGRAAPMPFHIAGWIATMVLSGLGDTGYVSLSPIVLWPLQGRGKPYWKKRASYSGRARLRGPSEHAISQFRNWDILKPLRCCPYNGEIARAVLVLQNRESR
ncbi:MULTISPECIES: hypothetical protein [Nocardiopsis]|uniref:Uncharacterized protein n=2 Tax=Nocardiopsis TaxID=2013 RepID=A0ABT4TR68_9ACTN|nr:MULTISPECIES: hypothetical protein [Nocardiopsis]MDA2807178.1 hypothetical protein [Nocardiopsis suaedae]MDA2809906.1 hypothetical protein [Nocardiopsis endophytica]